MNPGNRKISFAIFFFILIAPNSALADHLDSFAQITCVPRLGYFSVRTFHILDTEAGTIGWANDIRTGLGKIGVFAIKDLSNESCSLPSYDVSIQVTHLPGSRGMENARLTLLVDGQSVYSFDATSHQKDDWYNDTVHQVEFPGFDNRQVIDCVTPEVKTLSPNGSPRTGVVPLAASCSVIRFLK